MVFFVKSKILCHQALFERYFFPSSLVLRLKSSDFYMKGGISLSKGYKVIHRFSEDIDILITPPGKLDVKIGKNHTKKAHIDSRKEFFDWTVRSIKISGVEKIEYDPAIVPDGKYRNGNILLRYKLVVEMTHSKLKDGILLEVVSISDLQKPSL